MDEYVDMEEPKLCKTVGGEGERKEKRKCVCLSERVGLGEIGRRKPGLDEMS